MAKEDGIEVEGTILERLRNSRVRLLLSPYDLTQGRIVYRVK